MSKVPPHTDILKSQGIENEHAVSRIGQQLRMCYGSMDVKRGVVNGLP